VCVCVCECVCACCLSVSINAQHTSCVCVCVCVCVRVCESLAVVGQPRPAVRGEVSLARPGRSCFGLIGSRSCQRSTCGTYFRLEVSGRGVESGRASFCRGLTSG